MNSGFSLGGLTSSELQEIIISRCSTKLIRVRSVGEAVQWRREGCVLEAERACLHSLSLSAAVCARRRTEQLESIRWLCILLTLSLIDVDFAFPPR